MRLRSAFCGLAAAAFLAAAPVGAEIDNSVRVNITEFDLPNGLHVILSEDHTVPQTAVHLLYKVGSADESQGRSGFAHLFEHLMFCGSGHVSKEKFENLLGSAGAVYNASTDRDFTDYYFCLPSGNLPLVLYLESDRMGYFADNLRPGIVDEQRDIVKNELLMRTNGAPILMMRHELPSIVYPAGHPYSRPVQGSIEDLNAAEYSDVVSFYKKHYVPGNASLAVVGDFDTAAVKKMVEHWFSDIPKGRVTPKAGTAEPPEFPGVIRKTFNYKVNLPERRIVWHAPAEFQDGYAACRVLSGILCGSIYSRLPRRLIHDAQIASRIDACMNGGNLASEFIIHFQANSEHTLEEIQAAVDEEIERISQEPPSQKEIDLVVNGMFEGLYGRLQSNLSVAGELNRYYCTVGKADYFNQDLERYRRVTPQDVSACAKRFLRPDRRAEISIIPAAPAAQKEAQTQTAEEIKK